MRGVPRRCDENTDAETGIAGILAVSGPKLAIAFSFRI